MFKEYGGIIAFAIAWAISQLGKLLAGVVRNKGKLTSNVLKETLMKSGGMPSGHTASFSALTVFLGLKLGWSSDIFVLALCMLIVIVYDAINVRWAVGEQGKILNEVAKGSGSKLLKIVEGHTLPQVIVGGILGIMIGAGVYFWIGI